ncbi:MAG TPA: thioredoxin family protein [Chitinophagales bacterium]|nr:thioredoxin family protein [Chitinophagales bacterium]
MKDFKYWWNQAMTWEEYKAFSEQLIQEGKTTGADQSEEMVAYTKLNGHRMKRVEKTFKINIALNDALVDSNTKPFNLLVISEPWCGDASQSVPAIAEIARLYPEKIDLKIILRDTNTELIDQFLTNKGRAIPIFLFLDQTFNLLGQWGPRPVEAQAKVMELKAQEVSHEEMVEKLMVWYAKDKSQSIQNELAETIKNFL